MAKENQTSKKEELTTAELALIRGALGNLCDTMKTNKKHMEKDGCDTTTQDSNIKWVNELIAKCGRIMED